MPRSSILEKIEKTATFPKTYNARDYFNLPEGSPYQLIEGELVMSPSPSSYHQIILWNLGFMISDYIRKQKLGIVLYSPIDVYLDYKNAYQPDIIFISNDNRGIIKKHGIDGSPDLAIEILSPSNSYHNVKVKKEIYERSGVKEYLIVDPETKSIEVFRIAEKPTKGGKAANTFTETASAKAENNDVMYIKTLSLEIELKEVFKGVED